MVDVKAIPTTAAELAELGPGTHRFPASFSEYLDLVADTELRAEFANDEIILMSYASLFHEELVAELIIALAGLKKLGCKIYGSNHRVFQDAMPKSFAPDLLIVKGRPEHITPQGKVSMITNPWMVVEVLSPSTKESDLGVKLPTYKTFPSAHYILYVNSEQAAATLHTRVNDSLWRSEDFNLESGPMRIESLTLDLNDVYPDNLGEEE